MMTTIYTSNAIKNAPSIEAVIALVNEGTCEGMEGIEFTPEMLAGQYAYEAAKEAGYTEDADLDGQLDILREAGAKFKQDAALAHAIAIKAAGEE